MYDQDSFFTLGTLGKLGLMTLSVLMFLVIIWSMTRFCAHWHIKLAGALISFYFFVWLSPPIYYTYDLFIFDGLPLQNVIAGPPTLLGIFRLMTFTDQNSMSAHGLGLLGWTMIVASQLSQYSQKCRDAAN